MIPTFAFEPLQGFGPARLGRGREQVRAAMAAAGFPVESTNDTTDYYCEASIQTECGEDGAVQFIGVAYSPRFRATYRGVAVFEMEASDLFQRIAEADGSGPHAFDSTEYRFPNQLVTLWDADPQYDRIGNEAKAVWGQVGVGNQAYADAIARILADV